MASMMSVNEVRAIDWPQISCMVLMEATARFEFTDQTAYGLLHFVDKGWRPGASAAYREVDG
jgi:hypothetical protein